MLAGRSVDMIVDETSATGLYVVADSQMINDFLNSSGKETKTEVVVDFDGVSKTFTLNEFKVALGF